MRLQRPTQRQITEMMSWFTSHQATTTWSGPGFQYPFTTSSFIRDLKCSTLASFCLVDGQSLVGFGQYYDRLGHVHLGRLVINPQFRGQSLAAKLIAALIKHGQASLGLEKASLFVYQQNTKAVASYVKAGFKNTVYPQPLPIADIQYMTK
jgi:ribosomal protein S18 acetylase RimI-like enzyme